KGVEIFVVQTVSLEILRDDVHASHSRRSSGRPLAAIAARTRFLTRLRTFSTAVLVSRAYSDPDKFFIVRRLMLQTSLAKTCCSATGATFPPPLAPSLSAKSKTRSLQPLWPLGLLKAFRKESLTTDSAMTAR